MAVITPTGFGFGNLGEHSIITHPGLWASVASVVAATNPDPQYNNMNPLKSFLGDKWKNNGGTHFYRMTLSETYDLSCVFIAGHNLGTAGIAISISVSADNSTFQTVVGSFVPENNEPLFIIFPTVAACTDARIHLIAGSEPAVISFIRVGRYFTMDQPCGYANSPDTRLSRDVTLAGSTSIKGTPLTTSIIRQGQPLQAQWRHLSRDSVRGPVLDWIEAAQGDFFGIAFRPETYPDDVALAMFKQRPIPQRMGILDFMEMQIEAEGYVG